MLRLSNSAQETFFTCPRMYSLRYEAGWTSAATPDYLSFGSRIHQLLQQHYCPSENYQPLELSESLENEAQATFEAYKASYPTEPFKAVDCERGFEFELFGADSLPSAIITGRIDMVIRLAESGKLALLETKTESRGSRRNSPQAWTARHQASIYCHAASKIYGEPIDTVLLNVITRSSPAKQIGPSFRRDYLHRTPGQIQQALSDLEYVAGQVNSLGSNPLDYPMNTSACVNERGYSCTYYSKCHLGSDEGLVQIENPYAYQQV